MQSTSASAPGAVPEAVGVRRRGGPAERVVLVRECPAVRPEALVQQNTAAGFDAIPNQAVCRLTRDHAAVDEVACGAIPVRAIVEHGDRDVRAEIDFVDQLD